MSWRDDKSFEGLESDGGGVRGRSSDIRKGGPGLQFTRNVPKFLQRFQDPGASLDHEASLALKRAGPLQDDDEEDELDEVQKAAIEAFEAAEKEKTAAPSEVAAVDDDEASSKAKRKVPLSFSTTKKAKDGIKIEKPARKKRKAVKDAKLLSFDMDD
ncbi:hypothetical protein ACHHYP_10914 [Achlya hypogyna]|uniref:DUF4604 domain-containing protein n=1 Tax=Achlya hypogyna TaxID=1202772 RepID=A0A1V9YK80_ACHHY|nr:hypothetical protein ACHHYP_10914 [Achlya hypogyna]